MIHRLIANKRVFIVAASIIVAVLISLNNFLKGFDSPILADMVFSYDKKIQNENLVVFNSAISTVTAKTSEISVDAIALKKSLSAKKARELELNKLAAKDLELDGEIKLLDAFLKKGIPVDAEMMARMRSKKMLAQDWEMVDRFMAEYYSDEENFKIELTQYKNFNELKSAFDKRSAKTGESYGSDLLNERMAYKGSKADDIKKIVAAGGVIPNNALMNMVNEGNVQLAQDLKNSGYSIDVGYVDKYRSMNALELAVENYAINPFGETVEQEILTVNKLIELGVSIKVDDGTRDALDIALEGVSNHDSDQASKLLELAKSLHEIGIPMEQSHYEQLANIKSKYPELYASYSKYF